ncbi:MAG: hypothetical protein U1F35_06060 [Steroidobacteraceae bacterium]
MAKQPDVYIEIAFGAVQRVQRYLANRTLDENLIDDQCRSAVERQLEIAGDAQRVIVQSPVVFPRAEWNPD